MNVSALTLAMREHDSSGSFLPAIYVVEPTNRCNVNCIMCPNSDIPDADLGDMTVERFTKLIRMIAPTAELTMLYFMGESTLHPKFPELLRIARHELQGRIALSTNGLQLENRLVEAIVENVDVVIVCIDRWNKNAYEKTRRGSSFDIVIDSAERLLQARSHEDLPVVVVKTLDLSFPGDLPADIEREELEFIDYWQKRGAIPLGGWLNTWAGQLSQIKRLSRRGTPYSGIQRSPCADLWFKMVINWRGEVVMCCHNWDSSIVMGDLTTASVYEVWHGPALVALRNEHLRGNYGCNALCSGCNEWATEDELEAYTRLSDADLYRVF